MANYRIELRQEGQPTQYWSNAIGVTYWSMKPEYATIYTEADRSASLQAVLDGGGSGFPAGGCWVRLGDDCADTGHKISSCGCPRHRRERAITAEQQRTRFADAVERILTNSTKGDDTNE